MVEKFLRNIITHIQGEEGDVSPMGVFYTVRVWAGDDPGDFEGYPGSQVKMSINKVSLQILT